MCPPQPEKRARVFVCVTIMLQELFRPWVVCNASWHGVCVYECMYECVCVSVIWAGGMMPYVTVATRGLY